MSQSNLVDTDELKPNNWFIPDYEMRKEQWRKWALACPGLFIILRNFFSYGVNKKLTVFYAYYIFCPKDRPHGTGALRVTKNSCPQMVLCGMGVGVGRGWVQKGRSGMSGQRG